MDARGERIIVWGDSLSHHGSDSAPEIWDVDQGSGRLSGQPGDLLASLLSEQGAEAVRVNARVSRSAQNFFSREDHQALLNSDAQFRPSKVVIILGTNDLHANLNATEQALRRIVGFYQGLGAEVWGVGPFAYANDQLNRDAEPVVELWKKVFGGRFIDPRPFTPTVGRSGDGVHFGAESARITALGLADALLTTKAPFNWKPLAIGAGIVVGLALIFSWRRNNKFSIPTLGKITDVQTRAAQPIVTEGKKALKELEARAADVDEAFAKLKKAAIKANKAIDAKRAALDADATEAWSPEPIYSNEGDDEEGYDILDDHEDVEELLAELQEINGPDVDELDGVAEAFNDWKSNLRRLNDAIGNAQDNDPSLKGLGKLGAKEDPIETFNQLLLDPDPASMETAQDLLLENELKLSKVSAIGTSKNWGKFILQEGDSSPLKNTEIGWQMWPGDFNECRGEISVWLDGERVRWPMERGRNRSTWTQEDRLDLAYKGSPDFCVRATVADAWATAKAVKQTLASEAYEKADPELRKGKMRSAIGKAINKDNSGPTELYGLGMTATEKKRALKDLQGQLSQLYSAGSYAGNTPERSAKIFEDIKEVQAKITELERVTPEKAKRKKKEKKPLGNANRDLRPDEIMIAANDAALEGDYARALEILKQREIPKIATAYTKNMPGSDYDSFAPDPETGWDDEDGDPIEIDDDDLIDAVDMRSAQPVTDAIAMRAARWLKRKYVQPADTSFRPGVWYSNFDNDSRDYFEKGIMTERDFFLRNFTDDEQKRVYGLIKTKLA